MSLSLRIPTDANPTINKKWIGVVGPIILGEHPTHAIDVGGYTPLVTVGESSLKTYQPKMATNRKFLGYAREYIGGSANLKRVKILNSTLGQSGVTGGVLCVFSTTATSNIYLSGLGSDSGSSGNTATYVAVGSTTNDFYVSFGGSNKNITKNWAGEKVNDGKLHSAIVLGTWNTSTGTAYTWLDGRYLGSFACNSPGTSNTFNWVCAGSIRRTTDLGTAVTNSAALVTPILRNITIEAGMSLTMNPWQIFMPRTRNKWITPTVAAGGDVTVTPSAMSLTLAGQAPVISTTENVTVQPTAQALTLAQQSPVVSGAAVVQPTALGLNLTQQTPTENGAATVLPSAQSLSVALQSPTVSGNASVSVTAQSISLSQNVPTISTGGEITVNVSAFSLSLGQNTPFLSGDGASTPPLLGIVMGLHVPTIITPGLSVWDRRQNIDSIGWSNRRVTSAPAIVGSGSNGFTVFSMFMDGIIFWKPRNVRFGEIYSGNDEWVKRAKGSDIWNKRAIG